MALEHVGKDARVRHDLHEVHLISSPTATPTDQLDAVAPKSVKEPHYYNVIVVVIIKKNNNFNTSNNNIIVIKIDNTPV